jgi:hypothetical protein
MSRRKEEIVLKNENGQALSPERRPLSSVPQEGRQ